MIDLWLIFTLSIPFAEVVLHTIMDVCRKNIEDLQNGSYLYEVRQLSDFIRFSFRSYVCILNWKVDHFRKGESI